MDSFYWDICNSKIHKYTSETQRPQNTCSYHDCINVQGHIEAGHCFSAFEKAVLRRRILREVLQRTTKVNLSGLHESLPLQQLIVGEARLCVRFQNSCS